ncbi:MAG: hypothetical protein AAF492_12080, partial [Verrucomicrobiota bacterium]
MNRARTALTVNVPANSSATLRAHVRWLRGHPEILLRSVGSGIEAIGRLSVPVDLGTPGAANSRAVPNAGPAIFEVSHRPALPEAGEAIRVTARLNDPDGLSGVLLRYRIDPGNTLINVIMNHEGGGLYSATIPGQPADTLIAFHINAIDNSAPTATTTFPDDAPTRECLVRTGETLPSGDFGTYRIWMTQANFDFWANRVNASGENVDTTFVYGTNRVVYNTGSRYGSSDNYSTILTTPT